MPNGQWSGSNRRSRLPKDWPKIRNRVLKRDQHTCTHIDDGIRCSERATEVDHIRPGDDHRESNLRSLCSDHHQAKSSAEGGAALAAQRRRHNARFRRTETHPGLL